MKDWKYLASLQRRAFGKDSEVATAFQICAKTLETEIMPQLKKAIQEGQVKCAKCGVETCGWAFTDLEASYCSKCFLGLKWQKDSALEEKLWCDVALVAIQSDSTTSGELIADFYLSEFRKRFRKP